MSQQRTKPRLSLKNQVLYTLGSIISGVACHRDGTVNRRLLNLADTLKPPSATPIGGVKTSDHTVDISRQLWFRLFVPDGVHSVSSSLPVIIFFHGGGFVHYHANTTPFDTLCRRIAKGASAVVVSVDYRLAPEYKFPAQYDDGFDVVKFLDDEVREKVKEFPVMANLRRCFIAGDSAGGNIAHNVVVRSSGVEFKEVRICGLVMIQPFFGGEERVKSEIQLDGRDMLTLGKTDFFWKAFLPNGSDRDHPAVNVFGPNSYDFSGIGYPKTLVVVGGWDLLQDWQRRYVDGLRRFEKDVELVEYPDVGHGFYGVDEFSECDMLIAKIGEFVQKIA